MKILMLLDKPFPPDTRVENEIGSLQRAGHEVYLLCYGPEKGNTISVNIPKWFHDKFSALALVVPFYFWAWQWHVDQFIRRNKVDAIHVHDLRLAKVGEWSKKKYGLKYVLDLHENYPAALEQYAFSNSRLGKRLISISAWRKYEIEQIKAADAIIVVIEEMAERVRQLGGRNIFVVPNYVNLDTFLDKEDKPKLIYFGGMDRHRGLETLIHATSDRTWQDSQ